MSTQLLEAIEALNALEDTTKKNTKIEILKKHQENQILREMLLYTFNFLWVYGIKKLEGLDLVTEFRGKVEIDHWDRFKKHLLRLDSRGITGHAAIDETVYLLETTPLELRKWLVRVLIRDLQAGMQLDTVTKVYGPYIPQYNVLLASKDTKKVEFPSYIEPKSDGLRCGVYNYGDGVIVMRTRNGKEFSGFDALEEEARQYLPEGFMHDGELIGIDGTFKGIQKLAMKHASGKEAIFSIYDRVPIKFMEDQDRLVYKMGFEKRRARIEKLGLLNDEGILRIGETYIVEDMEQAQEMYQGFVDRGFEGAIFKMKDMFYEKNTQSKRCKKMIKLKPVETIDLEIVGVVEEQDGGGNLKGTLGAFVISYKGFTFTVGSGLKDKMKDDAWANPNKYIGKIAEIEYDCETSNKKGGLSLRFPRFISIREDKDTPDF